MVNNILRYTNYSVEPYNWEINYILKVFYNYFPED